MYLLDTNAISELRKAPGGRANAGVVAWSERQASPNLYLSVITMMELEVGILQAKRRRDAVRGNRLRNWFAPGSWLRLRVGSCLLMLSMGGSRTADEPFTCMLHDHPTPQTPCNHFKVFVGCASE